MMDVEVHMVNISTVEHHKALTPELACILSDCKCFLTSLQGLDLTGVYLRPSGAQDDGGRISSALSLLSP